MVKEGIAAVSASAVTRLQSNVVKAFTGYYRLKDLIHALRACKTLSAERTLLAKESFEIRNSLKLEGLSAEHRWHSIAKLLYLYMLGFPVHFGQVECIKMTAMGCRLHEKRMGYLGSALMLDHLQPTLTLLINCLKSDLTAGTDRLQALAITAVTSIASPEMARELIEDIVALCSSRNQYLRKKSACCAARLVDRVPEFSEYLEDGVFGMIGDKNPALSYSGLALLESLIATGSSSIEYSFIERVHGSIDIIFKQLQALSSISGNGASYIGWTEYDVGNIRNPFLQIKLLRLLRMIAFNHLPSAEASSDVLTLLVTNIDATKAAGQAVLYETMKTILQVSVDESLRELAISQIGKMLSSSDPNVRFVSLSMLNQVVGSRSKISPSQYTTIQKLRGLILECLDDFDCSIRRHAVHLLLNLISAETIEEITDLLLRKVVYGRDDNFSVVVRSLATAAVYHAPNAHWYVETLIALLGHAGQDSNSNEVSFDVSKNSLQNGSFHRRIAVGFIWRIHNTAPLQKYAVERLASKLLTSFSSRNDFETNNIILSDSFIQATAWCVGEYSEHICHDIQIEIIMVFERIASMYTCPFHTIAYITICLGKMAAKNVKKDDDIVNEKRSIKLIAINALKSIGVVQNSKPSLVYRIYEIIALINLSENLFGTFDLSPATSALNSPIKASLHDPNVNDYYFERSSPILLQPSSPAHQDVFAELAMINLAGVGSENSTPRSSSKNIQICDQAAEKKMLLIYETSPSPVGVKVYLFRLKMITSFHLQDFLILSARVRTGVNAFIRQVAVECAVPKWLTVEISTVPFSDFESLQISSKIHINLPSESKDLPMPFQGQQADLRDGESLVYILKICSDAVLDLGKVKLRMRIRYHPPLSKTPILEQFDYFSFKEAVVIH